VLFISNITANIFHRPLIRCFLVSVALTSCVTAKERERGQKDVEKPVPPAAGKQGQDIKPSATSPDYSPFIEEARRIESAFQKMNCTSVLESSAKYSALRNVSKVEDPLSLRLAVSYCMADLDPNNAVKLRNAIADIERAKKDLVPVWDSTFLDDLASRLYAAAGEKDKSLRYKRSARDKLRLKDVQLQRLDIEILQLSNGITFLSEKERARVREISLLSQKDERLFTALREIDDLIVGVNQREARAALLEQRGLIVTRIEQLFALEAAQIEQKKATGREAEAREQAGDAKRRFPTRNYELRIDALVGGTPAGTPDRAPGSVGAPTQTAPLPPDAISNPPPPHLTSTAPVPLDAQGVEKALTDARAALDAGNAELAVTQMDAIPAELQTEKSRSMRRQARNVHVRQLREKVRELYGKATSQSNKQAKGEALQQCKQILETILSRYPDAEGRAGVERNLRSIEREIKEIGGGK
jgi:hypothetical protein